ncbi:hypothetical protein BDV93DRAFT_522894 [Ceratobasidium sp. AG-I]|nr:hypothetical protein BDV93DRAFT_522894 [Ceratobasidium sp. AG-I]
MAMYSDRCSICSLRREFVNFNSALLLSSCVKPGNRGYGLSIPGRTRCAKSAITYPALPFVAVGLIRSEHVHVLRNGVGTRFLLLRAPLVAAYQDENSNSPADFVFASAGGLSCPAGMTLVGGWDSRFPHIAEICGAMRIEWRVSTNQAFCPQPNTRLLRSVGSRDPPSANYDALTQKPILTKLAVLLNMIYSLCAQRRPHNETPASSDSAVEFWDGLGSKSNALAADKLWQFF